MSASDARYPGTAAELVDAKQRMYTDITLLRVKAMTDLDYDTWCAFLDRRWEQYAHCNFGVGLYPQWTDFWKAKHVPKSVRFCISLLAYCPLVVDTVKQKLRVLAERATTDDTVCVEGVVGGFVWKDFLGAL